MPKYRVTIPLRLTFDREPNASHLAELLESLGSALVDDYGPPLPVEGSERYDSYSGPFVTDVRLGKL